MEHLPHESRSKIGTRQVEDWIGDCKNAESAQDTSDTISPLYKATSRQEATLTTIHVHSTLVTLIIIEFPMISRILK